MRRPLECASRRPLAHRNASPGCPFPPLPLRHLGLTLISLIMILLSLSRKYILGTCIYLYTCMHTYISVWMYIYIHMHTYTSTQTRNISLDINTDLDRYRDIDMHIYTWMFCSI